MKRFMLISTLAALAVLLTGVALAGTEKTEMVQKECFCGGDWVNKDVHVDVNGQRVYFCCEHCRDNFMKDPEGNFKKMSAKGIKFEPAGQTLCPTCNMKLKDKSVYVDYQGSRIYACSQGCADKIRQDPEAAMKKMKDKGQTIEKTPKNKATEKKKAEKTDKCGDCPLSKSGCGGE